MGGVAGGESCLWVAELACDADFAYFQSQGSSVSAVEGKINSIINGVNVQFEGQTDIRHVISAIVIRTSALDDPYGGDPIPASILLTQFRNVWLGNYPDIPRDVSKLFTGRDLEGNTIGIAWTIGAICTSGGYCLVQNIAGALCRQDLSAHELGHLWGAFHCSCPSFTMNPSITCSNQFSQGSVNSIVAHRDTRACLVDQCAGCPTDANQDGVTNVNDLVIVITGWGTSEAAADVNGDGVVDVADLVEIVVHWGPCTVPGV